MPKYIPLLFAILTSSLLYAQEEETHFFTKNSVLILFETDSYAIDSIDPSLIFRMQSFLFDFPECNIQLEGRTDFRGSDAYNLKLAEKRVKCLLDSLVEYGIPSDRFEAAVFGKAKPLASNNTERGMQVNRSVRIHMGCRLETEELSGRVLSDSTNQPIKGRVFVQSGYHFDTLTLETDGSFASLVPRDKVVSIEVFGEGYYLPKEYINLKDRSGDLGVLKALPYKEGVLFDFPEILFVGNEDVVLPEYRNQLPRIYLMMKGAPGYRFEIQGHVNYPNAPPQPTNTFHFDLSERRAKTIYNYLTEKGMDSTLLEWKGYSNWKMVYPNARTEAQQRQNRRISIKVLGKIKNE